MPSQLTVQNLNITSGGGTFNLATSGLYTLYKVQGSGGPVTLSANLTIQSSGTLANGLYYKFEWVGDITPDGNTITIMGTALPDELATKKTTVEAYYDQPNAVWRVFFSPSTDQSRIVTPSALTYAAYGLVNFSNTSVTSTASGSDELLAQSSAIDITNQPVRRIRIRATGTTGAGGNAKAIKLVTIGGVAPPQTIIQNTVTTTPTSATWIIDAEIILGNSDQTYSNATITFNGVAPEIKQIANTTAYDLSTNNVQFGLYANSTGGGTHTVTCNSFVMELMTEIL